MTCSQAQAWMQLYLDNRLSITRLRALERHLAHCVACRSEWELLEEVIRGVQSLEQTREPPWLTEAIMTRIAGATAQPPTIVPAGTAEYKQRTLRPAPFRLAAQDIVLSSLLATLALLSFILAQPTLRTALGELANPLITIILNGLLVLFSSDVGTFGWAIWALWVLLGVSITLLVAGSEVRSLWRQRIRDWLPEAWR